MNFEATLNALLGWVGRPIVATVYIANAPFAAEGSLSGPEIAQVAGAFRHGKGAPERTGVAAAGADELFFDVGDDGSGFFLQSRLFVDGASGDDGDPRLAIRLGDAVIVIRHAESRTRFLV